MTGQTVILSAPWSRETAKSLIDRAPEGAVCNVRPPTRSLPQNDKMWAMLSDVSRAKPEGRRMSTDYWKAAFMSALGHEVQWLNGIDGHPPFPVHQRSSRLTKAEMADLITYIQEYGDRHGVVWQMEDA